MAEDKPKIRGRRSFIYSKGKRKTSSARLRFYKKGNEEFTVNEKPMPEFFTEKNLQKIVLSPLVKTNQKDFEISAKVIGGGKHSQAEAIRLAISRAIVVIDEEQKKLLKKAGFLTRDSRKKERKKPGLKRARRAPQWSKR
ncbi:30S ribosomal protein S9 [Patescibacteria group bacterium]|nr:30S ribosomal protein S9 [Patescibacteria group bacterium]MBU1672838.1 30S ribosomal protein S9 [Patescibacteria group bacterium]MBU1963264.1 30S ribosomal protein S9 [Patescibacteria group bacterium]